MDSEDEDQGPTLSIQFLTKLLKEKDKLYYRTPELNEILYLNYRGFNKLENLHIFPELKCIYIEGNCIQKLEGFETNTQLRCLYIHENSIEKIEGLENNEELRNLNLSENLIKKVEGLGSLEVLENLQLKRNRIGKEGIGDVEGLLECPSISCLDISYNMIDFPEIVEDIFGRLPNLKVLYLQGNPVCKKIKNYRKHIVSTLRILTYLDDRPVFEDERRATMAWKMGGLDAEREERKKMREETDEKDRKQRVAFSEMMRKAKERQKDELAKKRAMAEEAGESSNNNKKGGRVEEFHPPMAVPTGVRELLDVEENIEDGKLRELGDRMENEDGNEDGNELEERVIEEEEGDVGGDANTQENIDPPDSPPPLEEIEDSLTESQINRALGEESAPTHYDDLLTTTVSSAHGGDSYIHHPQEEEEEIEEAKGGDLSPHQIVSQLETLLQVGADHRPQLDGLSKLDELD